MVLVFSFLESGSRISVFLLGSLSAAQQDSPFEGMKIAKKFVGSLEANIIPVPDALSS
jgi:hypothetical protein